MRRGKLLGSTYAAWMGQPVVLQVSVGDMKVPLRGTMLSESNNAVRMRIGEGWEIDIFKAMILAVDRDKRGPMHLLGGATA